MGRLTSKLLFFLLGVISTLIVAGIGIAVWNPLEKVEQEKAWFNQRVYGATDIFNLHLVKIGDVRLDNYKNWQKLLEEFNQPVPNEQKLVEYATTIRQGMAQVSDLTDETCDEYRKFIFSDPIDAKQRGKDAERLCEILGGFKEVLELEEKSLQSALNNKISLDDRAEQYKSYTNAADEKLIATQKQIGEFQSAPLKLP